MVCVALLCGWALSGGKKERERNLDEKKIK